MRYTISEQEGVLNESERQNRDGEENVPWGGNFQWPHGAFKRIFKASGCRRGAGKCPGRFCKAVQRC